MIVILYIVCICLVYTFNLCDIYMIYHWYIHCIWLLILLFSQWPAATTTALLQGRHMLGDYWGWCPPYPCGPDNRVARGAANPAVPLVHRHPCAADQWLDRQRYLHPICWQNGSTLSCFCGFFINGRGWGVHSNHVSHDTVHNLLVSQGSTAGYWPGVWIQRHTGDSCWVGNRARAATQSRWDASWQVQGKGKFMLLYIWYILMICVVYTLYIPCISNVFILYMHCLYFVYVYNIHKIYLLYTMYILRLYPTHTGQGSGTSLAPQTVSSKLLDEIVGLQCSDIMPEGRAASVVPGTVRGAHHSRHGSPLHPGVATSRSHLAR